MSQDAGPSESVPAEWATIPERLRWAIERQPPRGRRRGTRLFQSRMEERAQKLQEEGGAQLVGYHLSSIQSYLNGDVDPPLLFLQEAARLLGVREAWLISGHGAPTDAKEVERLIQEQSSDEWPTFLVQRVLWGPLEMGGSPPGRPARSAVLSLWTELVDRRASSGVHPFEFSRVEGQDFQTDGGDLARGLAKALRAPLMELEDQWNALDREAWDAYLVLVSEALRQYLRGAWRAEDDLYAEGRPEELVRPPRRLDGGRPPEEDSDAEEN